MNYKQTVNWLYQKLPFYQREGLNSYKKDITNVQNFFKTYGRDYLSFKSIHIAGTNGKGSVSNMLSSIFQQAGYKVGLFTSPHIIDFRERIKINGQQIPKDFVVDFVESHKDIFQDLNMSFFEMNVALAFRYFASNKLDIAIIEVGLGGRLDATNIINPELSIITNVSLDHINILGDNIESIAKEKAGVIKLNTPILIGEKKKYTRIFEKIAIDLSASLYYAQSYNYDSDLKGDYQQYNINTVVEAVKIIQANGYKIKNEHIKLGLKNTYFNTKFFGRWQIIQDNPKVICDIAHNQDALRLVFQQLKKSKLKKHVIIGFSNDKNLDSILPSLPKDIMYYICSGSNSRIMCEYELERFFNKYNLNCQSFSTSYKAYQFLLKTIGKNDIILITGSTFIVSDILKYLDKV
jgi:dihydrofolate synthase/folylpolyglutamate synthase